MLNGLEVQVNFHLAVRSQIVLIWYYLGSWILAILELLRVNELRILSQTSLLMVSFLNSICSGGGAWSLTRWLMTSCRVLLGFWEHHRPLAVPGVFVPPILKLLLSGALVRGVPSRLLLTLSLSIRVYDLLLKVHYWHIVFNLLKSSQVGTLLDRVFLKVAIGDIWVNMLRAWRGVDWARLLWSILGVLPRTALARLVVIVESLVLLSVLWLRLPLLERL